jgi:hypothetical protein
VSVICTLSAALEAAVALAVAAPRAAALLGAEAG